VVGREERRGSVRDEVAGYIKSGFSPRRQVRNDANLLVPLPLRVRRHELWYDNRGFMSKRVELTHRLPTVAETARLMGVTKTQTERLERLLNPRIVGAIFVGKKAAKGARRVNKSRKVAL
jgi:hypothetical protein